MSDEVKLILPTSWEPNLQEFFTVLGITSAGFGTQLFEDVFNALFVSSIELRSEFNKYYSVEYESLVQYLEIRYGKVLSEEDLDVNKVFIVTDLPQVVDGKDFDDETLYRVLECVRKLEEGQYENQI